VIYLLPPNNTLMTDDFPAPVARNKSDCLKLKQGPLGDMHTTHKRDLEFGLRPAQLLFHTGVK